MNNMNHSQIVNDVTQLNPVPVWGIATPQSIEDVQQAVRQNAVPISVGGGHFSMGGQTASVGSLHLDIRKLNQILHFSPVERTIRVQAGVRWCDLQRFLDPHNLSIKIMQTYANFTVGGSLSVNVHGRYMGLGPLILSVRAIKVVLMSGELVETSPTQNAELFYGVIGGYGGLGVIVEAELNLAENKRVERVQVKLPTAKYLQHFRQKIRDSRKAVFHNADLYPPHYDRARSVTWVETDKPVTVPHRLMPLRSKYSVERYFLWAFTETPFGKWRREYIIDPLIYSSKKVHWRNYEAGYNVAELEPATRRYTTYVLQEYFVPVDRFEEFTAKMAEILQRHRVNMLNVSIRHAMPDTGSVMAWAREEVFAFVLYYKQRVRDSAKNRVAVWTRELVEAAISVGGCYYLPYQAHARPDQFHRAFPRAQEMFLLKRKYDPDFRLRNVLWDTYYAPTLTTPTKVKNMPHSDFHIVYDDISMQDGFYRFLQNIYHLFPEDRFHTLIKEACAHHHNDEQIYREIQERLPEIKPFLAELFYALPALKKQKQEMSRQTLQLLGERRAINGYVEIGSTGRYISDLRKHLQITGPIILVNDVPPSNSPVDIVERGQLGKLGSYSPLDNYQPLGSADIPDASVDFVSCYIGLHHSPLDLLDGFVASIARVLRPGGIFILRDHDVTTPEMHAFVALAHAVFNAGLGVSWETNQKELRHFRSVQYWIDYLAKHGLAVSGKGILQANDPSDNTLLAFTKVA
jgi:FAD/FMN-containing dehydrogenase/SAM-dependent methyltransferase